MVNFLVVKGLATYSVAHPSPDVVIIVRADLVMPLLFYVIIMFSILRYGDICYINSSFQCQF